MGSGFSLAFLAYPLISTVNSMNQVVDWEDERFPSRTYSNEIVLQTLAVQGLRGMRFYIFHHFLTCKVSIFKY